MEPQYLFAVKYSVTARRRDLLTSWSAAQELGGYLMEVVRVEVTKVLMAKHQRVLVRHIWRSLEGEAEETLRLLLRNEINTPHVLDMQSHNFIPCDVTGLTGVISSSRLTLSKLTLSRDELDTRCDVNRGEFGCFASSPFFSVSSFDSVAGTAGTGGCSLSRTDSELLFEEDGRFVNDRDLSMDGRLGVSTTAVSLASSKVSCNQIAFSKVPNTAVQSLHFIPGARCCEWVHIQHTVSRSELSAFESLRVAPFTEAESSFSLYSCSDISTARCVH